MNYIDSMYNSFEIFSDDIQEFCRQYNIEMELEQVINIMKSEIYAYYPFLYLSAFTNTFAGKIIKDVERLNVACNYYYMHLIISDRIHDGELDHHKMNQISLSNWLQFRALQIFNMLLSGDTQFWDLFKKYYLQYLESISSERNNNFGNFKSFSITDFERHAAGKSAIAKIATTALSIIFDKRDFIEPFSHSQDYFHTAFQLQDDIKDWREDFKNNRCSFILSVLIESQQLSGQLRSDKQNIDDMGKLLYVSGVAEWGLHNCIDYYRNALDVIVDIDCPPWKNVIQDAIFKCNIDILTIRNFLNEKLPKDIKHKRVNGYLSEILESRKFNQNKNDDSRLNCNTANSTQRDYSADNDSDSSHHNRFNRVDSALLHSSIQNGLSYIYFCHTEAGYWSDLQITLGDSTEWCTGYVGYLLSEIIKNGVCNDDRIVERINTAGNWLKSSEHRNGGWGFNKNSGVDADSTSHGMMFLVNENLLKADDLKRIIKIILDNQNGDGGIGTYSMKSIKFEKRQKNRLFYTIPLNYFKGWCSSDTYLSGMVLCSLIRAGVAKSSPQLRKILNYITGLQQSDGSWYSYWSNGKMQGTHFCLRALHEYPETSENIEKAKNWVAKMQLNNGAWTDGIKNNETPYDTALAIGILNIDPHSEKYKGEIELGVRWLLKNQLKDGSWRSCPIMRVPNQWDDTVLRIPKLLPEMEDYNRLFTTSTVLYELSKYYSALFYD